MIKYYPEDNSGTIGLQFPLNGNTNVSKGTFFSVSRTTEEQAITNFKNLLLTKPGERYMHPRYGIGIQLYLFQQNTDELRTALELTIRTQTDFWLPYIVIQNLQVRPRARVLGLNSDPENAIQIVITFSVTESGANRSIEIFQQGGITTAQILN